MLYYLLLSFFLWPASPDKIIFLKVYQSAEEPSQGRVCTTVGYKLSQKICRFMLSPYWKTTNFIHFFLFVQSDKHDWKHTELHRVFRDITAVCLFSIIIIIKSSSLVYTHSALRTEGFKWTHGNIREETKAGINGGCIGCWLVPHSVCVNVRICVFLLWFLPSTQLSTLSLPLSMAAPSFQFLNSPAPHSSSTPVFNLQSSIHSWPDCFLNLRGRRLAVLFGTRFRIVSSCPR